MSEVFRLHRDMGCTRAELLAWLPGAARQAPFQIDGNVVTIPIRGGEVRIMLEEKPPRRVGSIALPVLSITFHFIGLDEPARDEFLSHFDLYTKRGGG